MRSSLGGVGTRVARLAQRLRAASADDLAQRVKHMSDVELEWQCLRIIRELTGTRFEVADTPEGITKKAMGTDERDGHMLAVVHRHLERLGWFDRHFPHGPPELRHVSSASSTPRSFGRALVVACPCSREDPGNRNGGVLDTFLDLVPSWFREEVERADIAGRPQGAR